MLQLRKCLFLLIIGLFVLSASSATGIEYTVRDLGTLDGKFRVVYPFAINEDERVVGVGYWDDEFGHTHSRGFIWDSSDGMRELKSFGGDSTDAVDINDLEQVVGRSSYPGGRPENACIWENDTMTDLGFNYATGINNTGQVVGGNYYGYGIIWTDSGGKQYFGVPDTRPSCINNSGQIAGSAFRPSIDNSQAFVWDETNGMQYIPLIAGYQGSRAEDINESGQCAGHAWTDRPPHQHRPFIFENGGMEHLGGEQGRATAINDNGEVVGYFSESYGRPSHGFIWRRVNGMQDLNDLVFPGHGFQFIGSASDINNAGQIVAIGFIDYSNNSYHAVLLIPVPEPLIVSVDIKPQSCPNPLNTKSKGVLPVAILATEDFDVSEIDVSTVLLEGVAPIRYGWEDMATSYNGVSKDDCLDCTEEGPDGFIDLTLKFDTQELMAALGDINDGDCMLLTITGELFDGTPIEGSDLVVILKKGK